MRENYFQKFKHLLEYFVAHLEHINNVPESKGYYQYIDPIKADFKKTGQGYKGDKIQKQIETWESYPYGVVCINVQGNYGANYKTKKCYLNWKDTGVNIVAHWDNNCIDSLILTDYQWWKGDIWEDYSCYSLHDLGLFSSEPTENAKIKQFFNEFVELLKIYLMMRQNIDYLALLQNNYNLILTGAPGTGKTYLAKQIAAQLILGKVYDEKNATDEEKAKMNEQCDFVQFHPSFDYTDFVEGLRPIDDGKGNVTFHREDGIFMRFCRKALKAYHEAKKKEEEAPKFVFIIDEINRGELSKIFGELFFCIDPGYRGEKGKVKTQYFNLWKNEQDEELKTFGGFEYFFIPENVYIIGTMNDIDRSVESMDFAMRRRFAWKEITAIDSQDMLDEEINDANIVKKAKNRMNNLNKAIEEIESLSKAYHIGPAYFLKLKKYLKDNNELKDDSWEMLWENHLEGLLYEYLRGLPNAKEDLDKLHLAFNNEEEGKDKMIKGDEG